MSLRAYSKHHSPRQYSTMECDEDGFAIGSRVGERSAQTFRRARDIKACDNHLSDLARVHRTTLAVIVAEKRARASPNAKPSRVDGHKRVIIHRPNFSAPGVQAAIDEMRARCARAAEEEPWADPRVLVEDIRRVVAAAHSLTVRELVKTSRLAEFVRPRQIALYLCRTMTKRSFAQIGLAFGDLDHSTVLHAVEKIIRLSSGDLDLRQDLARLREVIEAALCHA